MLADNIVYLKKNDNDLYEALKKVEEISGQQKVFLEDTKDNKKTLRVRKDGKNIYIHSKYDPLREADLIIDKLEEREAITEDTHVIFLGLGLGYHLDAFLKRHPQNEFSIYEPSKEVLIHYFNHVSLNKLPNKQLVACQTEYDSKGIETFFNNIIKKTNKETVICDLPAYQKAFEKEYQSFFDRFREVIKNRRSAIDTNFAFKKRWILNSVVNFREVLMTPNIIMENKGLFKDKTAVLVAAGPSLDYEIENLKLIKDKGLACIFTVGSSINTLLFHKLYPDAMCTYDPTELNKIVFGKVNEMEITSIPMIFGSSVGFETLQEYNGPKYHMLTSQDTVSRYFLETKNEEEVLLVNDAASIAVLALEMLYKLGFKQVILVGQNLAYLDEKDYADGIDYQKNDHIPDQTVIRKVCDVNGDTVFTTDSYLAMKRMMEDYIEKLKLNVINTTKGGANIAGSEFMTLEEVIDKKISKPILDGEEFKNIVQTNIYNHDYIKNQLIKITRAYQEYQSILAMMKQNLIKINELVTNKNAKQSKVMYNQLDRLILSLEKNDFAKVIALPMNRVEHELLAINVQRIKKEKNELKKISELVVCINNFVDLLHSDSNLNQQIMEILTKNISIISAVKEKE